MVRGLFEPAPGLVQVPLSIGEHAGEIPPDLRDRRADRHGDIRVVLIHPGDSAFRIRFFCFQDQLFVLIIDLDPVGIIGKR